MGKNIKYTVVIPTRDRQEYCLSAIDSVLQAKRKDVELIVLDNSTDKQKLPKLINASCYVEDVVLVHSPTDYLTMCDNWERAIELISGEWVMFIGDDDGCTPHTFEAFDFITSTFVLPAFRWPVFKYSWPCFPGSLKGTLKLPLMIEKLYFYNPNDVVENHSTWDEAYKWPPMGPSVYHGLVRTDIIRRSAQKFGRYFLGSNPDSNSGLVNATLLSSYMRYSFPLTILGACGFSNSASMSCRELKVGKKSLAEETISNLPVYDEVFKGTRLSVPYIAADFAFIFEKLGIKFQLKPDRFFESCIKDLEEIEVDEVFDKEKSRLIIYAKKKKLDCKKVLSISMRKDPKVLGPVGKGIKFHHTIDASGMGYEGIAGVCELLPNIYKDYQLQRSQEIILFQKAIREERLTA